MALLYLVRHALTRQDPSRPMAQWELDPAGLPALYRLAALPCFAGAGRIVASTEPKAYLTAEAIRARHSLPAVERVAALREIQKAGYVQNHDEVMAAVFRHPEQPALPGWEAGAAARDRLAACLAGLVAESGGRDLIVVSHATVLSLYLAELRGQSHVRFADWRSVGFPDHAVVDMATMQVVQGFGR